MKLWKVNVILYLITKGLSSLTLNFVDATLVTILGMSVYTTYAYLPAYVHHMGSYLGVFEGTQS